MPDERDDSHGESTPLSRAGQPAEVSPAFVFFASQESSYVSAQSLGVSGGNPPTDPHDHDSVAFRPPKTGPDPTESWLGCGSGACRGEWLLGRTLDGPGIAATGLPRGGGLGVSQDLRE